MKIGIISGSHRHSSQSLRIANWIKDRLGTLGTETYLFSLSGNPLPLWDEGVWAEEERWQKVWGPVSAELKTCDGFVVVSPEWSGMVPAGLKNFFLLCGHGELAHKPGMIVAVSSGVGGSYPVAELRESSYKNTRFCYIPDHVIVRSAEHMFVGDEPASDHDRSIRERTVYSLRVLLEYAKALRLVRDSGVLDFKTFPNGM